MSRSDLINPPRRVPDLALETSSGERGTLKPSSHGSLVLLFLSDDCTGCDEWLSRFAAAMPEIESWKGEVRVVVPSLPGRESSFKTLIDRESKAASAIAVEPPAVVIVDQWGEIHEAAEAGEAHAFLPLESIVEWVRYLATQCPECEGEAY